MLFGKKKQEVSCICRPEEGKTVCRVKILGMGCRSCRVQYENAQKAVKAMGLTAEVEYVTDLEKLLPYGAMRMPAIVVNERVVSAGTVLSAAELEKLLRDTL